MKTFVLQLFLSLLLAFTLQAAPPTTHQPDLKVNLSTVAHTGTLSGIATNEITFGLDYSSSSLTSGPLKVFYEFGDGSYSTNFNPKHIYDSSVAGTTVEVLVHTIDDYDDEEEEEEHPAPQTYRYTLIFAPSFGTGTIVAQSPPSGSSGLLLWQSWDMVPGHDIHYVATDYDCSSPNSSTTARFEFDSNYFTNSISVHDGTNRISLTAILQASGMYLATFNYKGISIDSTNLLFDLQVKQRPARDNPGCVTLTLIDDSGSICNTANSCSRVGKSHDPNMKEVTEINGLCDGSPNFEIFYQIHYQNIGDGAATHVTVEDYFDEAGAIVDVEFIDSKHRVADATPAIMVNPVNLGVVDYLRWHFKFDNSGPQVLRGTQEVGIHHLFSEEDTKGWIKIKVTYKAGTIAQCNALLNKAKIVFDCNEMMYTKNAFANENCPVSNEKCERGCRRIPHDDKTSAGPGQPIKAGSQLVSPGLPPNIKSVNWYPDEGLDLTNPFSPTADPIQNTTYTGIFVDDFCNRYSYYFDVEVSYQSNNTLQVHNVNGDLYVFGGSPPYNWSSGFIGHTQPVTNISGTVTITDNHNCNITFTRSNDPGPVAFNIRRILLFSAIVVVGIFLYFKFLHQPRK